MTLCVAWKALDGGVTLAADVRVTTDDHGLQKDHKLFRAHGLYWAFAGDVVVEHTLRLSDIACYKASPGGVSVQKWWFDNVRPTLDWCCADADFSVLVTDGRTIWVTMDGLLRKVGGDFCAIGSAAKFAYGFASGVKSSEHGVDLDGLFDAAAAFDESVSAEWEALRPEQPRRKNK